MKLDEFVRAHRDQLDSLEPRHGVWKRIDSTLFPSQLGWNSVVFWRVAAIVLFGACAFLLGQRQSSPGALSQSHDLTELTQFYSSEIAKKAALISTFENRLDQDQFSQELRKLEAMYLVLEEEMKRKPSREVKDALVLNMLVRIDLLNQQIKKLEDTRSAAAAPTVGV